jgi:hypothetical protein
MSRVETIDQDDVESGAPGLVAAKPGAPAAENRRFDAYRAQKGLSNTVP